MTAMTMERPKTQQTKTVPVRSKSSSRSKTLTNLELFCWHCQTVLKLSQSESGIPVPCENCGEYMITPRGQLAPNIVIGDFVIKKRLGAGGAGTVYLAYQRSLDRSCALKVLHDSVSGNNDLLKEARMAAKLNHPSIIQCYAVSSEPTLSYYAMEYVAGRTLKEVLNKNWKLAPVKVLNIAIQVCEALNHAWKESRLVHRDIKPDNIMISEDGDVKVADFGLARLTEEAYETDNNIFRGTPEYACPEVIRQEDADFRSDMYSLGVMMYQMLTGNLPFKSSNRLKLLKMHLSDTPASPRTLAPDLPKELDYIVMRLLDKSSSKRFASYDSLLKALRKMRKDISSSAMAETTLFLERLHRDPDEKKKRFNIGSSITNSEESSSTDSSRRPLKRIVISAAVIALLGFTGKSLLTSSATLTATPPNFSTLAISSILPDPMGYDLGNETVTISNSGSSDISLEGTYLVDNSGNKMKLQGNIKTGMSRKIALDPTSIQLDNLGDELSLFSPDQELIQKITFNRSMITQGSKITF